MRSDNENGSSEFTPYRRFINIVNEDMGLIFHTVLYFGSYAFSADMFSERL
jgi:hypothetical protein